MTIGDVQPCDLDLEHCEPVISRLLDAGVLFLIVGGWAVRFHARKERDVRDLDILVEFSADNWSKLIMALREFHVSVPPFEQLSQRPKPFRNRELFPLDILTAVGWAFSESMSSCALATNSCRRLAVASPLRGVSFDAVWTDSIETCFGESGLRVRVVSKAHLILSKEQSSREQDADDIKMLRDSLI